jgi:sulfite reductase (ferredoxin)
MINRSFLTNSWADSIYHSYSAGIIAAKAFLMNIQVKCNSQLSIIESLDELPNENWISLKNESFKERVLQIKKELPTQEFAKSYHETIAQFVVEVKQKIGK